jgi:hypothetical protein
MTEVCVMEISASRGFSGVLVRSASSPSSLSKLHEIHIKNASIVASPRDGGAEIGAVTANDCSTSASKGSIDEDHFTLSSISAAGIRARFAKVNLHSGSLSCSGGAIHVKRSSFPFLGSGARQGSPELFAETIKAEAFAFTAKGSIHKSSGGVERRRTGCRKSLRQVIGR